MSLCTYLKIHPCELTEFLLRNLTYQSRSPIQPSLHPNCHHHIVYTKFIIKVLYLPHCTREVWHCQNLNVDLIRQSINEFDWNRVFANKHVDEKVLIFNKKALNILINFISQ